MGIVRFKKSIEGLYYHEFSEEYIKSISNECQFVRTVKDNEEGYSKLQQDRAKEAQKLYHIIGAPTIENFKYLIKSNQVMNCPVTMDDIDIAQDMHGKDISYLKGRTTRRNPPKTLTPTITIPKELKTKNKKITIYMDMMCINKIGFMATISHPIYYRGCKHVEDNKHESFYKVLDKMLRVYNNGGFIIERIECDREFESIMNKVSDDMNITMDYVSAQDHVGAAERNIRTLKETYQSK